MKKLSIALAVAGLFGATGSQAAVVGDYSAGCLIPSAYYDNTGLNTAVGITSRVATTLYWAFFNVDSGHITDGQFAMTANDYKAFVLSENGGAGTSAINGYLVFSSGAAGTLSGTSDDIACNAFAVSTSDAAFIPSIPMSSYDFVAGVDLTNMGPASVKALMYGSGNIFSNVAGVATPTNATGVHARYFVDGLATTPNTTTNIVIWTHDAPAASATLNAYDDIQTRKSVTVSLPNDELNIVNVETGVTGMPSSFVDGFIDITLAGLGGATSASALAVYSVVSLPAFGTTQTLMGASY